MDLTFAFLATLLQIIVLSGVFFESSILLTRFTQYELAISTSTSIACATAIVLVYHRIVYPLILDPFRKYPVVDISDIRIVFPVTDVPRGEAALAWAKKYPDHDAIRVRVNRTTQMIAPMSPEALRDILSTNQHDFEKPYGGRSYLSRILGYGLVVSEGERHARQRKQLTPHFRIQNIRALHDLMTRKTHLLLQKMAQESAQLGKVEVSNWASKATLDIIGATLMSKDFNSLEVHFQPENEAFSQLTAASPGQTFIFGLGLILPRSVIEWIPTATNRMIHRNTAKIRATCEAVLSDLYANPKTPENSKGDILSSLIEDRSIPRDEIIDQMITFLGAGHETTATQVAWATHLLTLPENIKYQDLVRSEIKSHPNCLASPAELEKLPYLNAVCEETMRLFPSVTTTARKAIRNTTMAGTKVPKDTLVTLFPWAINRHPRYWGETAEQFVPERWIDRIPSSDRLRANKHGGAASNYSDMTFLHGNRSCIGKDFAKAELRCIVANMCYGFHVARLPGDNGVVVPAGSVTIKPRDGLFVTLTPVDN